MTTPIKISVITPVLNAEETIDIAAKSLVAQQYPNVEWLIFDGGSTDNTLNILKKYQDQISFLQSKKDLGPDYNEGISKATGDIICFLNADDQFENRILHDVNQFFLSNPTPDIISCLLRVVEKKQGKLITTLSLSQKNLELNFQNIIKNPATNARFFHRSIFEKLGNFNIFNEDNKHNLTHDKDFLLHLSLHHPSHQIINKLGYTMLNHKGSRTLSGNRNAVIQAHHEHLQIIEKFLQQSNLEKQHINTLQYWHANTSSKLAIYALLKKDPQQSLNHIKRTLKVSKLQAWLGIISVVPRYVLSKLSKYCRKKPC